MNKLKNFLFLLLGILAGYGLLTFLNNLELVGSKEEEKVRIEYRKEDPGKVVEEYSK